MNSFRVKQINHNGVVIEARGSQTRTDGSSSVIEFIAKNKSSSASVRLEVPNLDCLLRLISKIEDIPLQDLELGYELEVENGVTLKFEGDIVDITGGNVTITTGRRFLLYVLG